jgi:hypothetical protein
MALDANSAMTAMRNGISATRPLSGATCFQRNWEVRAIANDNRDGQPDGEEACDNERDCNPGLRGRTLRDHGGDGGMRCDHENCGGKDDKRRAALKPKRQ